MHYKGAALAAAGIAATALLAAQPATANETCAAFASKCDSACSAAGGTTTLNVCTNVFANCQCSGTSGAFSDSVASSLKDACSANCNGESMFSSDASPGAQCQCNGTSVDYGTNAQCKDYINTCLSTTCKGYPSAAASCIDPSTDAMCSCSGAAGGNGTYPAHNGTSVKGSALGQRVAATFGLAGAFAVAALVVLV